MPGADGNGSADGASVFCTFAYHTHMLHTAKHWGNLLISPVSLYQMNTLCPGQSFPVRIW